MERIRKIDIHAHATPFPAYSPKAAKNTPFVSAEELLVFYDELDIEKGVLLSLTSPEFHFEQITGSDCKYIADQYSDRFLWLCGVDPRAAGHLPSADLSFLLNHYKSIGARGMGELTAQLYADDPMMDNLFTHCEACDMPVTIHIGPHLGGCYGNDIVMIMIQRTFKRSNNGYIKHSRGVADEIDI